MDNYFQEDTIVEEDEFDVDYGTAAWWYRMITEMNRKDEDGNIN
jgi:hypothetical protein